MAKVKGAGDDGGGSNPTVQSKFDKSRGKGLKAPHLSFPGQTVSESGEGSGHMTPRKVKAGTTDTVG